MTTLAEELTRQQARCWQILEHALESGPAGIFLATRVRQSLFRAERAAAQGDPVAMIQALNDLRSYSD